jgi:hypothetical protein
MGHRLAFLGRPWFVAVCVATALLAQATLPADAQETTTTGVVYLAKRQTTVRVSCPSGELLVSGHAQWFRQRGPAQALTDATRDPSDRTVATFAVPDISGLKYMVYSIQCEAPTQVVFGGPITDTTQIEIYCPAETPYVYATNGAEARNPETGERVNIGYSQIRNADGNWIGNTIYPPEQYIGWNWWADLLCTSTAA